MIKFIYNRIRIWIAFVILFIIGYILLPLVWERVPRLTTMEFVGCMIVIVGITTVMIIDSVNDYNKHNNK